MADKPADVALIGLAVMGQNLALNLADRGYRVAVWNRNPEVTRRFAGSEAAAGRSLVPHESLETLVAGLARPRVLLLMVKAGAPVDGQIAALQALLEPGDIIIDGGNSLFEDTRRRAATLAETGLRFLGCGVSGGEEGARHGPSMMPGGDHDAYAHVAPMLQAIAARVDDEPCCTFIGADGAGHYVKMVHNGIEYADMQLIAEAYVLLRDVLRLDYPTLQSTFAGWNRGDLDSYLMEITADILGRSDPVTGQPMVEVILDKAGQKGTGTWTAQSALALGVPAPTIAEAVFARCISALKDERLAAAAMLPGPQDGSVGDLRAGIEDVRAALYASKICAYAQGFAMMRAAAREFGWTLDLGAIAMIWRGGCIIRAHFLQRIKEAYDRDPDLPNLLLDPYFRDIVTVGQAGWRRVVATAVAQGVPAPGFGSALAYYDSYRTGRLSANLIQAQRDYFGAHTFERTDGPGAFHMDWAGGGTIRHA